MIKTPSLSLTDVKFRGENVRNFQLKYQQIAILEVLSQFLLKIDIWVISTSDLSFLVVYQDCETFSFVVEQIKM